jgi:hypothetical protein
MIRRCRILFHERQDLWNKVPNGANVQNRVRTGATSSHMWQKYHKYYPDDIIFDVNNFNDLARTNANESERRSFLFGSPPTERTVSLRDGTAFVGPALRIVRARPFSVYGVPRAAWTGWNLHPAMGWEPVATHKRT